MRSARLRPLSLAALVLFGSFAPRLFAQTEVSPLSDAGTRAIQKGEEGLALYEQGKWNEALERFRQAEALYHSPVFGLYSARSLRNAGRLLDARDAFRAFLAETLDPSAPELWREAQRDGRAELAAVEASVPTVIVTVEGGSRDTLLRVDDRPAIPGIAIELDPGPHRIVAIDGSRKQMREVTLAGGAREQRIVVRFPAAPSRPSRALERHDSGVFVPGVIVAGIGGATLAAGGVVGILALNQKSQTEDNLPVTCHANTCPSSRKNEIDPAVKKARRLGTAADVLLVSGAVVTAAGVGMILFVPSGDSNVVVLASLRGGAARLKF